ncbi:MAG: tripartite tricarboxylate transporter substrate binding protein [Xanthobacteraceae bacterium]|nr:tripartite tricarboxylate transporter substrate binding protein [Xanthobacteraceae bacterium]
MWRPAAACVLCFALSSGMFCSKAAVAEPASYPDKTIRLIVPFPAGGLVDAVARLTEPAVEKAFGRPLIVDNRPAASGTLGTQAVAKADADGYTLLLASSTHTVAPATSAHIPYDIERDFAPIVLVAQTPSLFVVNPKVPVKSLAEFIALARSTPNKISYASPGTASQGHLVTLLFDKRAGIEMLHVPYRGGAPALMGIIGGEVEFGVLSKQITIPQIRAGNLRALATGGRGRDESLPEVPTLIESGFPDFEATQWVGLLAPARTAPAIIERLNTVFNGALQDPEMVTKLATQGMTPAGGTPGDFARLISAELKQWTEVARQADVVSDRN